MKYLVIIVGFVMSLISSMTYAKSDINPYADELNSLSARVHKAKIKNYFNNTSEQLYVADQIISVICDLPRKSATEQCYERIYTDMDNRYSNTDSSLRNDEQKYFQLIGLHSCDARIRAAYTAFGHDFDELMKNPGDKNYRSQFLRACVGLTGQMYMYSKTQPAYTIPRVFSNQFDMSAWDNLE